MYTYALTWFAQLRSHCECSRFLENLCPEMNVYKACLTNNNICNIETYAIRRKSINSMSEVVVSIVVIPGYFVRCFVFVAVTKASVMEQFIVRVTDTGFFPLYEEMSSTSIDS